MAATAPAKIDVRARARAPLESLMKELDTSPEGLSSIEAARRLDERGFNVLPEPKKVPLSRKAVAQLKNLFNVLLIVAALLSFVSGSPQMGAAILGVVVLAIAFSLFQERRAERAVEALRQLVPENVKVYRDGAVKQVPAPQVTVGDVLALEEGDKVPADARLLTAYELAVDNSTLTGESDPQPRSAAVPTVEAETPVTEYANLVFAGTVVTAGSGTAVVLATGTATRFGEVVAVTRAVEEPLSPLQIELDHTAQVNFYVAIALGLAFLAVAVAFLHLAIPDSILFMIGVMTSLVPEGLQVTVTLALALSSLALSKRNVVVKRLSSVETLGSTSVICVDKTGTITQGQMTVRKAWASGRVLDVTGQGYEPEGAILLGSERVDARQRADLRTISEIAVLCNRATLVPPLDRRKSRWTAVGDTTEAALLVLAAKAGLDPKKALAERPRVGLIPFESARKMMSSVHRDAGGAVRAYVKGAGVEILARSTSILWDDAAVPMTPERAAAVRRQIDAFARDAYRVLALAVRTLPGPSEHYESAAVERDLTFVGLVAILDPPRADVPDAVYTARSAGMRIVMLTGDHELTAEAIARKVGIITGDAYAVVTGYSLAKMSDAEVARVLDTPEVVFARISPEQKLRIVRAFQAKGETVAVTGDGVNDAPALLEADIGIAMGITGTDVARESADMVLLDDNFASIVKGTEVGRAVFDNLRKFLVYVFTHNFAELVTFVVFVLFATPLPLTVVQILAIDLGMEIPPSLALTSEPPEPGIMDRAPRAKGSRLFDLGTLTRSLYLGTLIGIAATFWGFSAWAGAGWTLGKASVADPTAYLKGTTMVLAAIMAGQLGTLFATRTNVESAASVSPLRNRWLLPSLAAELGILLAIVYVPFIQGVFGTAGLAPVEWLFLYSFVPVIFLLEEVRKLVVRRVILPARPAPARPAAAPRFVETEVALPPERRPGTRLPFVERGRPILVPVFLRPGEEAVLPLALSLAEYSSSRLVVARVSGAGSSAAWDALQSRLGALAGEVDIPCAYVDVRPGEAGRRPRDTGKMLRKVADQTGADTVIAAVDRGALQGGRATRSLAWVHELRDRKVVLVSPAPRQTLPERGTYRVLVPVFEELHPEPFDVAASLTASSRFPEVDVVAAKVIRLPPIVPVYSTYRPESLIDEEQELAFLKGLRQRPLQRILNPKVLIVRDIGRDLADFASERGVDAILMAGDRGRAAHGFLRPDEREIARQARCLVALALAAEPEKP